MIKSTVAILILFAGLSANANTTRILLQYDMGNQITRSGLTILSNGLVMRQESLMGATTYLPDEKLSDAEIKTLISQIDQAAQVEMLRVNDIDAALGGSAGSVTIYTSDGFTGLLYQLFGSGGLKKELVCLPGLEADVRLPPNFDRSALESFRVS